MGTDRGPQGPSSVLGKRPSVTFSPFPAFSGHLRPPGVSEGSTGRLGNRKAGEGVGHTPPALNPHGAPSPTLLHPSSMSLSVPPPQRQRQPSRRELARGPRPRHRDLQQRQEEEEDLVQRLDVAQQQGGAPPAAAAAARAVAPKRKRTKPKYLDLFVHDDDEGIEGGEAGEEEEEAAGGEKRQRRRASAARRQGADKKVWNLHKSDVAKAIKDLVLGADPNEAPEQHAVEMGYEG